MDMEVRTRFAPSPTGYLHLGGLRTALYTYLYARRMGGKFILRIEDTDQEREVPGAIEKIYASLAQAGLRYDEGPDIGGDYGPYIQTQRKSMYLPYAKELVEKGGAYYCFCPKERLDEERAKAEAKGETFKYDKHCLHLSKEEVQRRLDAGESYVIRQNIPATGKASFDDILYGHVEVDCSTLDDNVLIKADGLPTYNFANVIDDHTMGISHVTRGTEYLSSAPKYNLLYEAFGWTPPLYAHMPPVMREDVQRDKETQEIILDENGKPIPVVRKLSKRYGDPSFEDLLEAGYLQEAIINFIVLLGWSPRNEREFFTLSELEQVFDLEGVNKSPAIFNMDKLNWFNWEYIRRLSPERFLELATPWIAQVLPENFDYARVAQLLQPRVEVLNQIPGFIDFLAEMPAYDVSLYTHKKMKTDPALALDVLKQLRPVLLDQEDWSESALHETVLAFVSRLGIKNGQVLWPLRIAISGKASTPGGAFEIAGLLGKEESLRRLDKSIAMLEG
ncbi:MAG: glutamate--tRNA ligase [Clostridiales bacterium]|nr:glutamate--tRNA ligase [Bacillota bacterium]NLL55167.1 glutamate--tRNA ligase [Clostridiales bacterium]